MEKKNISNELNEKTPEKPTTQMEKPQSRGSTAAGALPPKRNSMSHSKQSTKSVRKKSEKAESRNSEKKLHENITVGSLEECKKQVNTIKEEGKRNNSAKGVAKSKLNKKSTGDTATKEGVLAKRGSQSQKKEYPSEESMRQSKKSSKQASAQNMKDPKRGGVEADYKRSSSLKNTSKLKGQTANNFSIKSGQSESQKKEMLQTQQTHQESKQNELLVEGSIRTGQGEVLNNEQFEKLQTSIENLSIDADDERDDNGETQDEQNLTKQEENKGDQLPTSIHVGQTNQLIAERQLTQQLVDSELSPSITASANLNSKKPASPASRAPKIEIPERGLNLNDDDTTVIDDSPLTIDAPSPGTMSTGPRLYSNPKQKEKEVQQEQKFGIKLHQVEQQISDDKKQENQESKLRSSSYMEEEGKEFGKIKKIMPEPLPLLPKVTTVFSMPPKCPIESIKFIQLKRFQVFAKQLSEHMSPGYDLVGNRRKMIQMRTEERVNKKQPAVEPEQLAKIDDTTHYIRSIIYAKDPSIIDQEHGHTHQRNAFCHLNNLDIKTLIKKKELFGEEKGGFSSISPRAMNRRFNQPKEQVQDAQVYKLQGEDDKTLVFESRFESGNLYLAQKVSEVEYNLLMSNDVNTQGHTQWFFFQVKNTRAKSKIRFNLLNYSKPDSLFNYGMKVSIYSEKKAEKKNVGWHKGGEDIRYFQNGIRKDITYYSKSFYTATFLYNFEYDMDTVYFAYSIPYTYSDLRNDLAYIETDPGRSQHVQKKTLCKTLSGEACELLTITSRDNLENFSQRKGVVLTSRVHPGETVGSWMMRGVLSFLTDPNNHEAKLLRENFVFKVIPMLNPDGVINGNYRCSLAGCDLNRRWKTPSKVLHPTIYHTKKLVKQIHQERGLVLFCDLHGHSRKQNVFMYGCNNKNNPGETRIFPFILSKMNDYFSFEYSRFGVQKSKEATARVALYKELKAVNIFTMESSFAGCDTGPAQGKHLTSEMLETLGHDCCRALLIYCNLYVPPELADLPYFRGIMARKKAQADGLDKKTFKAEDKAMSFADAIMTEFQNNKALLHQDSDSSSGSESAPSEDNMQAEELVKQLPTVDATLKKQIKKNQEMRKKEENNQNNLQSQVKLRRQSSGQNLKRQQPDPKQRNQSPVKRQLQPSSPDKAPTDKPDDEKKKKPKVETRDAQTQTDRSDYQLIKAKMMREQQLKAQYASSNTAQQKQEPQRQDQAPGGRKKSYTNKNRSMGYPSGTVQLTSNQPQSMPPTLAGTQPQPPNLSHIQTSPMNSKLSNLNGMGMMSSNRQPQHVDAPNEQSQKPIMMPNQNKYSFMGVSSVKQSNHNVVGSTSSHTAGTTQGQELVSKSQPGSSFAAGDPNASSNAARRIFSGSEGGQNIMAKSGFSEKTAANNKDNIKDVPAPNSDTNVNREPSGFRYHSSIHDVPQGISPQKQAALSAHNAQQQLISQAQQELKQKQHQIQQQNASRIEETLRMNQHANKMEIDHRNVVRGGPIGTGDPNFNIDIQALAGKPGALPAMSSLSGQNDPNNLSPIQKAGHTVSGGNPNPPSNSMIISGGPSGQGQYTGGKVGSATGNYQTIQLTQENESTRIGMFSSPTATTGKKQIFQLPSAGKSAVHQLQQQQFSMNLDASAKQRKISATKQDGAQIIIGSANQHGMTMNNYQMGPGTVSNFNSSTNPNATPGSINVSGRRLKQQDGSMLIRTNCSHNNFGSLMTSPAKLTGQNQGQGQFSPIQEQIQQKRQGGASASNQPLRASLSKNKSGNWPPNATLNSQVQQQQQLLGQNQNSIIQIGGQTPIAMTGLSQYRHQQQIVGQGVFPQNQNDNGKFPPLNTRSMPKPIQKGGIDWPGNTTFGLQSPSSHMVVQHGAGIGQGGGLSANMIMTAGGQIQNFQQSNPGSTVSGSEAGNTVGKKSNYPVSQHQKYMSGSILQVTSTSSAPGKSGSSPGPAGAIGVTTSNHKVSHSGSCQQPHSTTNKPTNSTSSANHKRNNQGGIFSMGVHGATQKPVQKTQGARTPSSTDVIRGGQVYDLRNPALSLQGQLHSQIDERRDEDLESPVNKVGDRGIGIVSSVARRAQQSTPKRLHHFINQSETRQSEGSKNFRTHENVQLNRAKRESLNDQMQGQPEVNAMHRSHPSDNSNNPGQGNGNAGAKNANQGKAIGKRYSRN